MPKIKISELDKTEKGIGSDMTLYFNHCIVKVAPSADAIPKWAKYNGFSQKGHVFNAHGETVIIPANTTGAYIEWTYPKGWYNTLKSSVFCQRIPKRQYHKGISSGNFKVTSAEQIASNLGMFKTPDAIMSKMMSCVVSEGSTQMSVDFVDKVFNPFVGFPSLEEAYVLMRARKVFSRALSSILSMFPHPKSHDFIVFCNEMPVGEMLTKNKFKLMVPEFKPECSEYFQKENVTVVS